MFLVVSIVFISMTAMEQPTTQATLSFDFVEIADPATAALERASAAVESDRPLDPPDFMQLTRLYYATEPEVTSDADVYPLAKNLEVDVDAIAELLIDYGKSPASAQSVLVRFVGLDFLRRITPRHLPEARQNAVVGGFYDPLGVNHRNRLLLEGRTKYWHYIGIPIMSETLNPEALARINEATLHELGHAATTVYPVETPLYKPGPDGQPQSLRGHRLHGVIPLSLAVAYLGWKDGRSRSEALHYLHPPERRVRQFERRHAGLNLVSLVAPKEGA